MCGPWSESKVESRKVVKSKTAVHRAWAIGFPLSGGRYILYPDVTTFDVTTFDSCYEMSRLRFTEPTRR